jgi:hypothetical protein
MVESPPASVAELKSVATKFRLAIERCGPSRLSIPFEKFPEGSCGEAAQLLRTFLQKRGLGTFKYVSGFRDKEGRHITHAWLEAGPITVDITADQFVTEISEKVIVAENSAWHTTTWRVEDQEDKEGETDPGVSSDYRAILAEFDRAE